MSSFSEGPIRKRIAIIEEDPLYKEMFEKILQCKRSRDEKIQFLRKQVTDFNAQLAKDIDECFHIIEARLIETGKLDPEYSKDGLNLGILSDLQAIVLSNTLGLIHPVGETDVYYKLDPDKLRQLAENCMRDH